MKHCIEHDQSFYSQIQKPSIMMIAIMMSIMMMRIMMTMMTMKKVIMMIQC